MAGTLVIDTLKSSTTGPAVFQNTSGTEVGQLCRAWVNFNGVTTATIRASFNVSSVVRNGTGDYTVNFTNAMVDANYTPVGTVGSNASIVCLFRDLPSGTAEIAPTTSGFVFTVQNSGSSTGVDALYVCLSVFR